jgi:hypothetical protein
MTDLPEHCSLGVRELQSPIQLALQDAVFRSQIFVPRQQLLIHRPGESDEGFQAAIRLARYSSSQPAVKRKLRLRSIFQLVRMPEVFRLIRSSHGGGGQRTREMGILKFLRDQMASSAPAPRWPRWVKGGCGWQAHGTAGRLPAPEIPGASGNCASCQGDLPTKQTLPSSWHHLAPHLASITLY